MRNLVIARIQELETKLFGYDYVLEKLQQMSNLALLDLYSEMLMEYCEL